MIGCSKFETEMYYVEDQTCRIQIAYVGKKPSVRVSHKEQTKSGNILAVTFSPDGNTLASAGTHKEINLWHVAEQELIATLNTQALVWTLAFSPEGRFLAADVGAKIRVWDMKTLEEVTTLEGCEGPVYSIVFSADGKMVVAGSLDGTIRVWDTAGFRDD